MFGGSPQKIICEICTIPPAMINGQPLRISISVELCQIIDIDCSYISSELLFVSGVSEVSGVSSVSDVSITHCKLLRHVIPIRHLMWWSPIEDRWSH